MKKYLLMLAALPVLLLQSAAAAPVGWYNLSATWRDGSFTGRFYYDSASPFLVTGVNGMLTDSAQTTAIHTVWNTLNPDSGPWAFLTNATAGEPDLYDAGFYLNVVDQGGNLSLDVLADNGLYDWSRDFSYFTEDRLNGSPLRSFSIAQVEVPVTVPPSVPEPGSLGLMGLGLLGCVASRMRRGRLPAAQVKSAGTCATAPARG